MVGRCISYWNSPFSFRGCMYFVGISFCIDNTHIMHRLCIYHFNDLFSNAYTQEYIQNIRTSFKLLDHVDCFFPSYSKVRYVYHISLLRGFKDPVQGLKNDGLIHRYFGTLISQTLANPWMFVLWDACTPPGGTSGKWSFTRSPY